MIKSISIQDIKEKIEHVLKEVENEQFIPLFKSLEGRYVEGFHKKSSPSIRVEKISTVEDLSKIPDQRGFYLIFTDYKSGFGDKNECQATISDNTNAKVIYRGESYNVRTRLESHLFHNTYHKKRKSNSKRIDNYIVCLKIEDVNVNLDEESDVSKVNWYVAYHGFPNSTRVIREIAESAFDQVFGKPICSKD